MPTIPVDDDIDPTELVDQDDQDLHDDEDVAVLEEEPAPIDPDAEIVAEIEKVAVDEEEPAKQKAHMIPRHLIDAPLTLDDLLDEGAL